MSNKIAPLIIAHRGGHFWESSDFSYIADSVRDGADIVELDVRARDDQYLIQHSPFGQVQGYLAAAIEKLGGASLYLDVKGHDIDVNQLITYVRSICSNHLIVGSFSSSLLRSIRDPAVERNYHCASPWFRATDARFAKADWVNPLSYLATERLAMKIQYAGFKFTPSGNYIWRKRERMGNQVKFAKWGAYAVSTYHVKEMKRLLAASGGAQMGGLKSKWMPFGKFWKC
jgi:hypothetical protein